MKNTLRILVCVLAIGCLYDCTSDTGLFPEGGELANGKVELAFTGSAPTRSTTTTISKEEANNFLITVSKGDSIVRGPQTLGSMNMSFPVGQNYSVYAENCSESDAETSNNYWGQKRFVGTSGEFGINKGETTKVRIPMSVDNASMCVFIDPSLSNYFKTSCTVSLSQVDRGLQWTYQNAGKVVNGVETDGQLAYFNLGADSTRTVTYSIMAVADGKTVTKDGQLVLKRAKCSRLRLAYDSGYFNLTISTSQEELYVNSEVTFGPNDIIQDQGDTDASGNNDDFHTDESEVDYDQYN